MQDAARERRSVPRLARSHPVRVQPSELHYPAENCITLNVSGNGFYFTTFIGHYYMGMELYVSYNLEQGARTNHGEPGRVVQVDKLKAGRWGIAVHILRGTAGSQKTNRDLVMVGVPGPD
jgi:hypothetical protein